MQQITDPVAKRPWPAALSKAKRRPDASSRLKFDGAVS
jgi:hypothetical protein